MSPKKTILLSLIRSCVIFVLSVAILGAGGYGAFYFMTHKPTIQRRPPVETATLVRTKQVEIAPYSVSIHALGTVIPAVEVTLQPRVGGEVIDLHPAFLEGGIVKKGEVLVRLDPVDYELAITEQEAQLENARYTLKAELGQQAVAEREWELLDLKQDASELDRELALRQPQLRNAQAALKAQEARLKQAKLDLERTTIKAPCNAIIQAALMDKGNIASTQTTLATIVGTDTYWVRVNVPITDLQWLILPNASDENASAVDITTTKGAARKGKVISVLSDLETEGSMARLLVEVTDPLCIAQDKKCTPLLLGEFVRARIQGREVDNVITIPRTALREGNEAWVMTQDKKLHIQSVEVIWTNENVALLRGMDEGTHIVVSDLAAPVEGMALENDIEKASIKRSDSNEPTGSAPEEGSRS